MGHIFFVLLAFLLIFAIPAQATPRAGLIDSKGRWVIEPTYMCIRRVGARLGATSFDHHITLFNSEGKEISVPLPHDCVLTEIYYSPSNASPANSDLFFQVVDSIKNFHGVIRADGKEIIPHDKWEIEAHSEGHFLVHKAVFDPGDTMSEPRRPAHAESSYLLFDELGTQTGSIDGNEFRPSAPDFQGTVVAAEQLTGRGIFNFFDVTGRKLPIPAQAHAIHFAEGFAPIHTNARATIFQRLLFQATALHQCAT